MNIKPCVLNMSYNEVLMTAILGAISFALGLANLALFLHSRKLKVKLEFSEENVSNYRHDLRTAEARAAEWRDRFHQLDRRQNEERRYREPLHTVTYDDVLASRVLSRLHMIAMGGASEKTLRDKILNWKTRHYILKNKGD